MRKIILNLAISLDGYISDEKGGFDWIAGQNDHTSDTQNAYDFESFLNNIDIIVMGSKAYEDVVLSNLDTFKDKKILVATSRQLEKRENVTFIHGAITEEILILREQVGKNIWLFGGAGLTDPFIREKLIDEYIIGIIPTILGGGRSLFKGGHPPD
ncbi:dihydrofolate reductase family protein [Facklamia sp. 7083-14-GEN3]|uniref:dihydrofolate reductase family protein n=1 Tax=Facklamia sp. 7083-14-GEN3 TaxID=2973478 RepID=UPI00215CF391|nr:dihydrofolate reductase family protein [Facklamia sp. 7083-14-GEN3]MCR8969387.1 dihydrofolate reductase family protein [Facklamia sp. 7083-14-GEN3]